MTGTGESAHLESSADFVERMERVEAEQVLAHSSTRFPCYLGMEINAKTQ